MKCPKDNISLELVSNRYGVNYACPKCEGVFYSKQDVKAFQYNYQSNVLTQLFESSGKSKTSNLNCPHCSKQMNLAMLSRFELDFCPNCYGIWFDKNELAKTIADYGQEPNSGESELLTLLASWIG
jgi:Uncharacterized protein conserved in bacteria